MKRYIRYISIVGILLSLFSACNLENGSEQPVSTDGRLRIKGEIVGADIAVVTKAIRDDLNSYDKFETNDKIGFFSFHENLCNKDSEDDHLPDDDKYYKNHELTYTPEKMFEDLKSDEYVELPTLGVTFAYFPYSDEPVPSASFEEGKYVKADGTGLTDDETYVHIFTEDDKVEDILTASVAKLSYSVNYAFRHQFSMLLFDLGEGFSVKKQDEKGLTVHLTERILGAHVTREWGPESAPEVLKFVIDRRPATETQRPGHIDFVTGGVIPNYPEKGKSVYRMILPHASKVDYILLKDENGNEQKVYMPESALPKMEPGWIYSLTIRMDGIVPTVYPCEIEPWGDDPEEIEVNKLPGIYTRGELEEWAKLYNENQALLPDLGGDKEDATYKALAEYGTKEETGWTFYLRGNIDCDGLNTNMLIRTLGDGVTLDGGKCTLSNLTLQASGNNDAGIIGEMTGGTVRDLHLVNVTVVGGNAGTSAGCIAAKISGGVVTECTVKQASMKGKGYVGVLTGTMSGGAAGLCKFRGTVTAPLELEDDYGAYQGVVGMFAGYTPSFSQNIVNQVRFTSTE